MSYKISAKKIKSPLLLILLIPVYLIFLSLPSMAADYYVSPNGNDSNNGTQTAPFRSISKINNSPLKAGDNIYFERGGTWDTLLVPSSGVSGNEINYGAYGVGGKPSIRGFYADGKSYIKVQDVEFKNNSYDYPVILKNFANHISIENCNIIGDTSNTSWAALYMERDAHHNRVIGCFIERRNPSNLGDAVNLVLNSNHNLIEGNTIGKGSHYALSLEGNRDTAPNNTCSFNIIRNNIINNTIGSQFGFQNDSNNNVIEGNVVIGGKYTNFEQYPRSFKSVSKNNIIRHNIIRDNLATNSSGISTEVYKYGNYPANVATNNHTYNNVITNISRYPLVIATNGSAGASAYNNYYKNNIVYNNGSDQQLLIQNDSTIYDNYFSNNLFYKAGVDSVILHQGSFMNVQGVYSRDPGHFWENIQQDPNLDSDFKPQQGSPCIDAGAFLAKVVSSNGSGTAFNVDDAGYFTDGYGIVPGDTIRVGAHTATITSIDYASNRISTKNSISWQNGDPVSLAYNGSRPDIGVYEYGSISAPKNLRISQ